jgi:hypothetical protein
MNIIDSSGWLEYFKDCHLVARRAVGPAFKSMQIYFAGLSWAGGADWSFFGFFSGKV